MPPVLAYWAIRGLAQPVRLLLNYVGEEFEDRQYKCGRAPDYDRSAWNDIRESFGLDFPNLPYYIDGDVKITQSNAIIRYIGRKHNLCGTSEVEKQRVDLMLEQSMDFRNGWVRLCYNPNYEKMKDGYLQALPKTVASFEKYLGEKNWFAGDNITVVDFIMYELLDQHLMFKPDLLEDCPKLKAMMSRFEALPAIKTYMESDKFMKNPMNNPVAKFGAE